MYNNAIIRLYVIFRMINVGKCYQPKRKAEADNTYFSLDILPWISQKTSFNKMFIIFTSIGSSFVDCRRNNKGRSPPPQKETIVSELANLTTFLAAVQFSQHLNIK